MDYDLKSQQEMNKKLRRLAGIDRDERLDVSHTPAGYLNVVSGMVGGLTDNVSNRYIDITPSHSDVDINSLRSFITRSFDPVGRTSSVNDAGVTGSISRSEMNALERLHQTDEYQLMKEGLGMKTPPIGYEWIRNPSTMMHELRKISKDSVINGPFASYDSATGKYIAHKLNPTTDAAFEAWLNDPSNRSLDEFCNNEDVEPALALTITDKALMGIQKNVKTITKIAYVICSLIISTVIILAL